MADMNSIAAAVTSLKMATDIAKTMLNIKNTAEVQGKVIELQAVILSAQSSALAAQSDQFSMIERMREIEKEIVQLKNWETEKQRYELKAVDDGAFVYVEKPEVNSGQPPHWLCANCYRNGRASILQNQGRAAKDGMGSRREVWACPHCKASVQVSYEIAPARPKTW